MRVCVCVCVCFHLCVFWCVGVSWRMCVCLLLAFACFGLFVFVLLAVVSLLFYRCRLFSFVFSIVFDKIKSFPSEQKLFVFVVLARFNLLVWFRL